MMRGSKADEILTLLFMLLAIAAVVCFFVASRAAFYGCGGSAVVIRLVQYLLRYIY